MPHAAPRPCTHPGCSRLVHDGSGRCERHPRQSWERRPDITKRVTGRRLQAMRERLFRRDPLCVACKAKGVIRLATQRDHVVPLAEGGADDEGNEQGLCDDCHDEKSKRERLRGRVRSHTPGGG